MLGPFKKCAHPKWGTESLNFVIKLRVIPFIIILEIEMKNLSYSLKNESISCFIILKMG